MRYLDDFVPADHLMLPQYSWSRRIRNIAPGLSVVPGTLVRPAASRTPGANAFLTMNADDLVEVLEGGRQPQGPGGHGLCRAARRAPGDLTTMEDPAALQQVKAMVEG